MATVLDAIRRWLRANCTKAALVAKHIDPVLFDLFLTSGVYRQYAERYLLPEQMDEADIQAYLG